MKASYYPGCSLEGTAKPYNASTLEVCRRLGVELQHPADWACCGSSPALKMNRLLSLALGAYNLACLAKTDTPEVVIPCPFCYRRLNSAQQEMAADQSLKQRVSELVETEPPDSLQIQSLLDFMRNRVGLAEIEKQVVRPLEGLKLVPYYGCYLVKPPELTGFDDPENPSSLDEILKALGAQVLDWDFKTECCGAGLSLSKTETVVELSGRITKEAAWLGADAIVVACQLCQANLDMRQAQIAEQHGKNYYLPVVYFTQLMGLAFGLKPREVCLHQHVVDTMPLWRAKDLLK
jgi:heterodisulfide reductase subunit B